MIDQSWYVRIPNIPERLTAGGIVVRREKDTVFVALIKEGNLEGYILPKGGVESGETIEQAGRREIGEELGITQLNMIKFLGIKERLSFNKKHWAIVHYFLFTTDQIEAKPTDTDHEYKVAWFPIDDLPEIYWPEQRDLLNENKLEIKKLVLP